MRLFYRKKMLENRHFLIGIFQHFTTVADIFWTVHNKLHYKISIAITSAIVGGIVAPIVLLAIVNNIKLVLVITITVVTIIYLKNRSAESTLIRKWQSLKFPQVTAHDFANSIIMQQIQDTPLPYNRAKVFASDIENVDTENDFPLVYQAEPSNDEMLFREFGYLATTRGVIIKQRVKAKNTGEKFDVNLIQIPFQSMYRFQVTENKIRVFYANHTHKAATLEEKQLEKIVKILNIAINCGWTRNSDFEVNKGISEDIMAADLNEAETKIQRETNHDIIKDNAVSSGLASSVKYDLGENQINDRFGKGQGHGHVGEQYGDTIDRLQFKFAKRDGATHARNGRDREVNFRDIQTKYLKTAKKSVGQVFNSDGSARYIDGKGRMMMVEVPRDQYQDAVKEMAKRIKEGKVPGKNGKTETDISKASQYVKKGAISYEHSKIATKSIFDRNSEIPAHDENGKVIRDANGNTQMQSVTFGEKLVWSAGGDFMTGAASALPTAIVTGIWVYCNCRWQGTDEKDALKTTSLAVLKPVVWGGSMYMVASQFAGSKAGMAVGEKVFGSGVSAATRTAGLTKGTVLGLTAVVTVGPDIINCLRGRISVSQLAKNSAVTGTGMLVGSILGAGAGPVGAAIGGAIGGALGSLGAKKVLDHFVEDDAVLMIKIAKEEFIETVLSVALSSEEIEAILQDTFLDKHFSKMLRVMYAADDSREYIHSFFFDQVVRSFKNRELPDEKELLALV